ncbi:branched-chain amino acid ABC transporter permease [Natrinema halophilum]|uniref:branched-chain amino acid ABC transporter permease n=1 Tax=Natrinema halophilum TaxID=1699371 RepID=UPI001F27FD32|nr:branched-chain amino acid ABC transporter permease [Natrinema halophilum]UHQ96210.1 branched-chain amino acid ABC transporter permease [Natrinema halophilum]
MLGFDTRFLGLVIDSMILVLFGMGLNILFGYTGLLSFGHSAFYGIAAYAFGLSITNSYGLIPTTHSVIPAILIGVFVATLTAAIAGVVIVQRGGIYFAMLTLALTMLFYELANTLSNITGGDNGLIVPSQTIDLGVYSFSSADTKMFYYLVLVIVVLSLLFAWRIVNSPYGELITAVRENPERLNFIGLSAKFYQWTAFVISGAFAGLAGSLAALRNYVVSPSLLSWTTAADPLLVTLIGGAYSFLGPVIGTIVYVGIEEILIRFTDYWQISVGIILAFIVLFFPNGILGVWENRSDYDLQLLLKEQIGNRYTQFKKLFSGDQQ